MGYGNAAFSLFHHLATRTKANNVLESKVGLDTGSGTARAVWFIGLLALLSEMSCVKGRLTRAAGDAAARPCIGARFGYVRYLEVKSSAEKPRRA